MARDWPAMEQLSPLIEAFDYLDLALAVCGALLVSLWFGRGKSARGILSGAAIGGLAKPVLGLALMLGLLAASGPQPEPEQTPEQRDKTLEFWTK